MAKKYVIKPLDFEEKPLNKGFRCRTKNGFYNIDGNLESGFSATYWEGNGVALIGDDGTFEQCYDACMKHLTDYLSSYIERA